MMKRKWTREQVDFPWDAVSDEHMSYLKLKFMHLKHSARENNLFRYLLGEHNRVVELESRIIKANKLMDLQEVENDEDFILIDVVRETLNGDKT